MTLAVVAVSYNMSFMTFMSLTLSFFEILFAWGGIWTNIHIISILLEVFEVFHSLEVFWQGDIYEISLLHQVQCLLACSH